ncbi:MAG: BREX system ATP-binding domain-containing protein [Armatimonadota bacterium]
MGAALSEWVTLLREEYLASFIADGGAAVKIAMIPPEMRADVMDTVTAAADGYLVARVDAAETKVHMIHQLFHAVARQVDWDALADRWLRARLQANGIVIDPAQPLADMDAIARANGLPTPQLFGDVNRLVSNGIMSNFAMCKEFRTAMAMLCLGLVNPHHVTPTDAEVVKQWLVGERCNLGALKRMQIYQRIGRHNARLLLASLAGWAQQVGYRGLVLILDLSVVVDNELALMAPVRYSRAAVLDTYEVLRQCIDDIDELSHFLLVAIATPGLTDPHNTRRNVDNYTALKMRIVDDVHDVRRTNPLNALVRLTTDAAEGALR